MSMHLLNRKGLVCKMSTEFATYYKAVQEHPSEKGRLVIVKEGCLNISYKHLHYFDRYQWYCHADDDMYVNIPQLSHLLQQYDSHKPYYIGKWAKFFWGKNIIVSAHLPHSCSMYIL